MQLPNEKFFWNYITKVEDVGLFRNRGTFHHYACLRCLQPIEARPEPTTTGSKATSDNETASTTDSNECDSPASASVNGDVGAAGADAAGDIASSDSVSSGGVSGVSDSNESNEMNKELLVAYNKVKLDRARRRHKRSKLRMLSGCRHFMCELCVKEGAKFTQDKGDVTCGVCGEVSNWVSSLSLLPPDCGPRILCLDGTFITCVYDCIWCTVYACILCVYFFMRFSFCLYTRRWNKGVGGNHRVEAFVSVNRRTATARTLRRDWWNQYRRHFGDIFRSTYEVPRSRS